MLKAVLLVLILLSCTAVGRSISNMRKCRCELLGELLAAMRVLRLRMLNSMEPLGVLLRKSDSRLFCELGNALWEGGNLQQCWQDKRRDEHRRSGLLSGLNEADLHILDTFFQNLGRSGRDEQNQLFAAAIESLEESQVQARQHYLDSSKLCTALGSLIGIAICILIV